MSTTFSPYSISHLLNTQSSSGVDPSAAAKAVQRAYNNSINANVNSPQRSSDYPDNLATSYVDMNDTYTPPPIEEGDERDSQRDSHRFSLKKSSSLLSFMFKQSEKPSNIPDDQSVLSATSLPVSSKTKAAPDHRNTIGGEGVKQGPSPQDMSNLAKTPNATSYLEGMSSSGEQQTLSGDMEGRGADGSSQGGRRNPGGQWRDKYVLKFNGWNSTKPDSNLPPPSSSRSTQSPFHVSAAVSQQPSRASTGMVDEQSSEGSAGRYPSFEDSKEVYAHGELLQPRSTIELDLMSSSRSMDPRLGSDHARGKKGGAQDDKELQRKRTNSL